jgi:hypothetical protein
VRRPSEQNVAKFVSPFFFIVAWGLDVLCAMYRAFAADAVSTRSREDTSGQY